MKLLAIHKTEVVEGTTLAGALDEKDRLWLCKLSSCGTFLDPVFGPMTSKTTITDPLRNRSNDPYILAGRKMLREISE